MEKMYYVDTAIWIDFYENRKDRFRPLGEWALEMFKRIADGGGIVLYSNITIRELLQKCSLDEIKRMFKVVPRLNLKEVCHNYGQASEARKLSKERELPFADCLHAILARDNFAVMVSRDRHFEQLRDIADMKKPEELL